MTRGGCRGARWREARAGGGGAGGRNRARRADGEAGRHASARRRSRGKRGVTGGGTCVCNGRGERSLENIADKRGPCGDTVSRAEISRATRAAGLEIGDSRGTTLKHVSEMGRNRAEIFFFFASRQVAVREPAQAFLRRGVSRPRQAKHALLHPSTPGQRGPALPQQGTHPRTTRRRAAHSPAAILALTCSIHSARVFSFAPHLRRRRVARVKLARQNVWPGASLAGALAVVGGGGGGGETHALHSPFLHMQVPPHVQPALGQSSSMAFLTASVGSEPQSHVSPHSHVPVFVHPQSAHLGQLNWNGATAVMLEIRRVRRLREGLQVGGSAQGGGGMRERRQGNGRQAAAFYTPRAEP